MSPWVLLLDAGAFVIACALLYFFHARTWYWHILSIGAALALGFAPPPPEALRGPVADALTGFVFLLLMVWGIGGMLTYRTHGTHKPKHA